jgi:hypothetical protein
MSFHIKSLPKSQFQHLFDLSPEELASQRGVRMVATEKPGFPCRVSLADAEIGEEVILVNHQHQSVDTPYQSSHAVFVRPNASQSTLQPDEVPEMLRSRTLSLRAFDQAGMLILADLAEGTALEASVETIFENPSVEYIHVHFAKPGCYAARVDRARVNKIHEQAASN